MAIFVIQPAFLMNPAYMCR